MNNNVNEELGRISKKLMFKEVFYGFFLISLNKQISTDIDTACVSKNGINCQLTINPDYWKKLSDNHKEGLLKHELLHIAFMHLSMCSRFPDKKLFNIAADLEINQYINKENLHDSWLRLNMFPELNLPERAGTKVYYDALQQAKQDGSCPNLDALLKQMDGSTIFDHVLWGQFSDVSDAERDLIRRQIEHQLKEAANYVKNRGTVPGELKDYIDSLFEVKPAIFDWKAYLRRFVNGSFRYYTKKTRRKLNKRFVGNPAIKIKPKSRILIGVDTSGSVSNEELEDFFSEIHHIWKTGVFVDIIECDARIYPEYEYKGKFSGKIHGRGGTNFQPIIDFYDKNRKKYNTLIYFTDGECSAPTRPRNSMLWVISSNITDNGRKYFEQLPWHKFIIPKSN